MIKIENTDVYGWETAVRGMRNPMNSWDKSDSGMIEKCDEGGWCDYFYEVGNNDLDLMRRLCKAGTDHRKFMRYITGTMDVTAPLYWWKEFDTYKVGTVSNSCSTMHKIHEKEFTIDDFSHEHLDAESLDLMEKIIYNLNDAREFFINGVKSEKYEIKPKNKEYWWQMIQILPNSYNQRRTALLNYEVLANMYDARKEHKLDEWKEFCKWIEKLPYADLITEVV